MSLLVLIIAIVAISSVLGPIAKGYGDRIAKSAGDPAELLRLRSALEQTEQRLQDAERRLHQAEERLDFQEKLLSSRASPDSKQ